MVAATAGLREGELLGLRWEDVDLDRQILHVRRQLTRTKRDGLTFAAPKCDSERSVLLTKDATDTLGAHRALQAEERLALPAGLWHENGLVFASAIGTPLYVGNMTNRSFRPILERAGLPRIRFHDLRHTCATLMLLSGANPRVVQERLGHRDVLETLNTYSHVLPNMQETAVEALDDLLSYKIETPAEQPRASASEDGT